MFSSVIGEGFEGIGGVHSASKATFSFDYVGFPPKIDNRADMN
jgi:hypothetical protein